MAELRCVAQSWRKTGESSHRSSGTVFPQQLKATDLVSAQRGELVRVVWGSFHARVRSPGGGSGAVGNEDFVGERDKL